MLTVEDLNRNLLEEWTKSLEHLNREEKIALYNLGILVINNGIDCLYDVHKSLAKHNQSMYVLDGKLGYELQEDIFLLKMILQISSASLLRNRISVLVGKSSCGFSSARDDAKP